MEYLEGGREQQIIRHKQGVHRPMGFWSPAVHALLKYLRTVRFYAAPDVLGTDEQGREILSFLEGNAYNYPLPEAAASTEALTSAATLLRTYHDATVSFLSQHADTLTWLLPSRTPQEVICHGDYAPYNVVLNGRTAVGIIDFDTAHPGPRVWDVAYALYRWAPLKNLHNPDTFGNLSQQVARAKRFCDVYGLPADERAQIADVLIERLQALLDFMTTEAQHGNETFQQHLTEGHHLSYHRDIDYIKANREEITGGLTQESLPTSTSA